jgi:hypothetical protein
VFEGPVTGEPTAAFVEIVTESSSLSFSVAVFPALSHMQMLRI